MKFKRILSALFTAIICISGTSVCYAEPAETETASEPATEISTEVSENPTEAAAQPLTEPVTVPTTEPVTEPPVTTPSFYDEILKYVGDENAPQLNENLNNNALTIDQSSIDYSKKSMYTITTRSGDVFYLIINSSDGSVYFLNSVDNSDLTALLAEDSQKAGNEINQSALENMQQTEPATDSAGTIQTTVSKDNGKADTKKNLLTTLIMIIAVVIVSLIIFFVKSKRNNGNSYDDDFFDSPEETNKPESEIIPFNEPEEQENIPYPEEEPFSGGTNETAFTAEAYSSEHTYEDNDDFEEADDV